MRAPRGFHLLVSLLGLAAAAAWGCAAIIDADFDKPFQTGSTSSAGGGSTTSSAATTTSGGTGGAPADAGPDDAEAGPGCTVKTEGFDVVADAALVPNNFEYGTDSIVDVNFAIGIRTVLRFDLDATPTGSHEAFDALAAGKALSLQLTLTHAASTKPTNACSGSCPHSPGRLRVYPLRSDWVESTVTWKSRDTNAPWGADGASSDLVDHGDTAALVPETGMFTGEEPTMVVSLDPSVFTSKWLDATKRTVSLLLTPEDGLTFVFAAREYTAKEGVTLAPSRLEVKYCAGDL